MQYASLPGSTDIHEGSYIRGSVTDYQEIWGSMIFNEADLMQHGAISEQNLLKLLPDKIEGFIQHIKEIASISMLGSDNFAEALTDGAADGTIKVDRVERFSIGKKVTLVDDNTAQADYYVTAVNLNTQYITLSATRGGAAASLTAFTTAQNAKFYYVGVLESDVVTNKFTSLKSALLSSTNGGSASLYGQTKTAYPYLQAINVDGSGVTQANILEQIFLAYGAVRQKARGKATKVVMSLKHWGSSLIALEAQKGGYKVLPNSMKATAYGWSEVQIMSFTGEILSFVGVQECDNDVIFFLDLGSMKFYSNGFFKKRESPDGDNFFAVRNTTGYQYIVDVCCFGDLVVHRPGVNGILYGIDY